MRRRTVLAYALTLAAVAAPAAARASDAVAAVERPHPDTYAETPERARPEPLLEALDAPRPEKVRRVDLGTAALLVTRVAEKELDGRPARVTYDPAPGLSFYARAILHPYFQVGVGWQWSSHAVTLEDGALGVRGDIESDNVTTYALALHLMPTLPLGERVKLWVSAGVGWGRCYFGPMRVDDVSGAYVVRDRAAAFVEVPLGLGGLVEIVPDWLSVDLVVTAAPTFPEDGTARVPVQAIDGGGHKREIGALPGASVTFVQAIGLSALL